MPGDGAHPRIRRGWLLAAVAATAAVGGIAAHRWMPVRPAGPVPAVARPLDDASRLALRSIPASTVRPAANRVLRPVPRWGGAVAGGRQPWPSKGAGQPALRPFAGLHLTTPRKWPRVAYEIRRRPKPPLRLMCGACPIVNAALHSPPGASSPAEKIAVNAVTYGAITMLGSGKIDLVEWDPP
ncbi:MAG TPA: hypothetical protein VKV57_15915 [bacterium]|nr:hypothetical protein [bacterium]